MKTTNKSGGKNRAKSFIICLMLFNNSCTNNHHHSIKIILENSKTPSTWINSKYIHQEPLAQLINIRNFCDTTFVFKLSKPEKIQIYAVGELVYQLSTVKPEYFFKSDDIEISIIKKLNGKDSLMRWNFLWLKGKNPQYNTMTTKYGVEYNGALKIDSMTSKYLVNLKIPWRVLGIQNPQKGEEIFFDASIGDNDDEYAQKAKISLFNKADISNKTNSKLGRIFLGELTTALNDTNIIYSTNYKISGDTNLIQRWKNLPYNEIKNIVMGTVKDKYDLSAKIKSCWDQNALNLYFEIQDNIRKTVDAKKIRKMQTFLDYAWIEDSKGKKVWEMHELDSSPAGGAIKNRKIDTQIRLNAGVYTLHYISDESHAYNSWDDLPPETPFYGVVLYNEILSSSYKSNNIRK